MTDNQDRKDETKEDRKHKRKNTSTDREDIEVTEALPISNRVVVD
jgi:hypothetical protein